jgi:two-component system chemotaxis response regulator CheB
MPDTTKVLIVDDSRLFREVLERSLSEVPGVAVAGSVWNGLRALEFLRATPVDLVTLDLEMPYMGGLETLRAIQHLNALRPQTPPVGVLLVSAYTSEGAAVTIEGLEAGAFDFVTKPSGEDIDSNLEYLRRQLQSKIRIFKSRRRSEVTGTRCPPVVPPGRQAASSAVLPRAFRALVIGVSTGGPAALAQLLPDLTQRVATPVLVVQHMPAGFTKSLAESLSRKCQTQVVEAEDAQLVQERTVYIAPGNRHLVVREHGEDRLVTGLNDQPAQNGSRPSADVLFRSAAAALGARTLGIVLTGMGCDGTKGLEAVKRAGGCTIAQDEASSVVWGMPGSAVSAGCIDQVLPLSQIAAAVQVLTASARAAGPRTQHGGS